MDREEGSGEAETREERGTIPAERTNGRNLITLETLSLCGLQYVIVRKWAEPAFPGRLKLARAKSALSALLRTFVWREELLIMQMAAADRRTPSSSPYRATNCVFVVRSKATSPKRQNVHTTVIATDVEWRKSVPRTSRENSEGDEEIKNK